MGGLGGSLAHRTVFFVVVLLLGIAFTARLCSCPASFFRNPAYAGRKVLHFSVLALYVQEVQVQQAYGHMRPCPCSRHQCRGGACAEGGMHMAGSYPGETGTVDKPQLYCGFQTFRLWLLEPFLAVVGVNSQTVHSLRPFR